MSHVIPKFVTAWLRKTSGGALLRTSPSPEVRVQDGRRERWFCQICEERLNKPETWFANHVFHLPRTPATLSYDENLLQFAAGLLFRGLLFLEKNHEVPALSSSRVFAVREQLREAVLAGSSVKASTLWMIATDFVAEPPPLPEFRDIAWHRYLERSTDSALLLPDEPALAMVRVPRFAFFASVDVVDPARLMPNSMLRATGGRLDLMSAGESIPWGIFAFFAAQAKRIDRLVDDLPMQQEARTDRKLEQIGMVPLIASPSGAAALLDRLRAEGIDPHDALAAPCICGESTPFKDCHGGAFRTLVERGRVP